MTREYLEESHAAAGNYGAYLEERFQGEVYGEALFRKMAERCAEPEQKKKLRILEQLERETKEFLLPALRETGSPGSESPERIAEGQALGAELVALPWNDLMRVFQKELERFVRDFERAEALAPAGKETVLRHITAHEQALLNFVNRELDPNRATDSLESVVALLRTSATA